MPEYCIIFFTLIETYIQVQTKVLVPPLQTKETLAWVPSKYYFIFIINQLEAGFLKIVRSGSMAPALS